MNIRYLLCLPLLGLVACSTTPTQTATPRVNYQQASVAELPGWRGDDIRLELSAMQESCKVLAKQPSWQNACSALPLVNRADASAARAYFERHFDAWQLRDGERQQGLITGYYEPLLNGSRTRSERTPYPVYGVPADLVSVPLTAPQRAAATLTLRRNGNRYLVVDGPAQPGDLTARPSEFALDARASALKGRVDGNRLVPYYRRNEIDAGRGVASAPVLAWVENATELFFLQVQGSGRVQLEDGSMLRLGYADQNGWPYQSIGRWLVDRGEVTLADASMQGIAAWVRDHPDRMQELFNVNPSYVFFRRLPDTGGGPLGALGVPLTDGFSLAVDPRYIPLGAPVYLATTWPLSDTPLRRLMLAQDTGGAIRGAVRADFFWGFGTEAGMYAGRMKQQGSLWLLLPKGMKPPAV